MGVSKLPTKMELLPHNKQFQIIINLLIGTVWHDAKQDIMKGHYNKENWAKLQYNYYYYIF